MKMKTFITAITLMMSMMSFANGEQGFVGVMEMSRFQTNIC